MKQRQSRIRVNDEIIRREVTRTVQEVMKTDRKINRINTNLKHLSQKREMSRIGICQRKMCKYKKSYNFNSTKFQPKQFVGESENTVKVNMKDNNRAAYSINEPMWRPW